MLLPGLDEDRFPTLMADPPWLERGSGQTKRGADRHYPLLATKKIPGVMRAACDDEGRSLWRPAFNAHLYMWVTNNFLEDGLWVMRELGFRYVTNLAWPKLRYPATSVLATAECDLVASVGSAERRAVLQRAVTQARSLRPGLGQYFRGAHELLLFGVRGQGLDPSVCTDRRDLDTVLLAPHLKLNEKVRHSGKPLHFYERIEARSHGPYLEFFARSKRPGWTSWGNQLPASDVDETGGPDE